MAEANLIQEGDMIDFTPTAAVSAGEVLQLPDGRAAVAHTAIAAGDKGAVQVGGIYEVAKTTSMVMLQSSEVFWDASTSKAHLLHGGDKDFPLGVVVEDATSAATTVKVALNQKPRYTLSWADGFASINVQTAGFVECYGAGNSVGLAFSATAEVQKTDALTLRGISPSRPMIVHTLICVNVAADNAAADINVGLANATHASDADSITESLFIHIDGASTNINAESDDGTTEVTATDTTDDFTAGTPFLAQWDLRDNTDIQLYINGVNRLPSSVFKLNAATGPLKLLAHIEKTSDDSPGNISVAGGVVCFDV